MEHTWEKVEGRPDFWKPQQVGDYIEGTVDRFMETQYGTTAVLTGADGGKASLPNTVVLSGLLAQVKEGQRIKVVFTGETPSNEYDQPYKNFDLFIAKDGNGKRKSK